MASNKKMLLVIDSTGRIVAAAQPDDGKSSKMNVGISALPGQEIHEIEIPEALTRLKSGHEFHLALSHAKLDRATRKIKFRDIVYKKLKH
jgi:hypothetical protein